MTEVDLTRYSPEFIEEHLPEKYPYNTVRTYKYAILDFVEHIQEHEVKFGFKQETVYDDVEKIRNYYKNTNLNNVKTNAIRRLLEYTGKQFSAERQQAIDQIDELIKYSKVEENQQTKLTSEEIKQYLLEEHEIDKALEHANIRQTVIIKTLLETGVRAGELCALKPKDIDFEPELEKLGAAIQIKKTYVSGHGIQNIPKTKDSRRSVEMREEPASILKDYIKMEDINEDEAIFPSYSTVYKDVKKPFKKAGIKTYRSDSGEVKTYVAPHWMRHTFITWMRRKNVDIDKLMDVTGHGDREALKEYDHLTEKDVVGIYG